MKLKYVKEPTRILVPVSGGKDSQVCFAMAVDAVGKDRVLGVHQHTGFDHSLTYAHMDYMRERYGAPIIDTKSEKYADVPDVMLSEVTIPGRFARVCTRGLKTEPWFKWLAEQPDLDTVEVWLGMRAAESQDRRADYGGLNNSDVYAMGDVSGECTAPCRNVVTRLPIVEMTTPAVFRWLRARGDKVNPLYRRGFPRIGCFPCALAGGSTMRKAARDPEGRENLQNLNAAVQIIKWASPRADVDTFFRHDIDAILSGAPDPFGFYDDSDDAGGCSWCNL